VRFSYTDIVIFSSVFGLFFLAFIAPPIIAIAICLAFFAFIFFHTRKFKIDAVGVLVLANFIYWLVSGFIVGAIDPFSFLILDFYDGDARIFLSYVSLLYFSVSRVKFRNLEFVTKTFRWIAILSILFCLIWLPTKTRFLAVDEGALFTGFITSHTGAGTFYGAVAVILFFCGYIAKNKPCFILSLLMVIVVLTTASRATMFGILVVAIWYVSTNFKINNIALLSIIGGLFILVMPLIASGTFLRTFSLLSWDTLTHIQHHISLGPATWQPGDTEFDLGEGDGNVMTRIILWGYALHQFIQSPVIGIGWGRFNDVNIVLSGISGMVDLALQGEQRFNVSSAHNSYLQLLCESGLVGLWLLMKVWWTLYQRLAKAKQDFKHHLFLLGYYTGCQALILFTLTAALFGHTLAAPANCIPVLTIVGAGLAYHRTDMEHRHALSLDLKHSNALLNTPPTSN
jgi:O-antigen ligase